MIICKLRVEQLEQIFEKFHDNENGRKKRSSILQIYCLFVLG